MKQGYFFPLGIKFVLMNVVIVTCWPLPQGGQRCANGFLPYRLTQAFDGIPFDLTQMGVAFVRGMKITPLIVQHIHGR